MFGYLKVLKDELLVKEYEQYKAVYCTLCKQLHKEYSIFAKVILSYDCTLYALLLLAREQSCCGFKKGRCKFFFFKRCCYCAGMEESLNKTAAVSVLLAYYKLLDDIEDSPFIKRVFCSILRPLFNRWRTKAIKKFPEYDVIMKEMSNKQKQVEQMAGQIEDAAAEPTAEMMSRLLELEASNAEEKRVLNSLGYHLGRWIYFIDAIDDIEKDINNKNFNPFIKVYSQNKEAFWEVGRGILNQCVFQICGAYNLLNVNYFEGILYNIFFLGLHSQQDKVFSDLRINNTNKKQDNA